jgi:hypothetical protein
MNLRVMTVLSVAATFFRATGLLFVDQERGKLRSL